MTICGLLELLAANRLEGGVGLSSEDGNERADGRIDAAILYSNKSSLKLSTVVFVHVLSCLYFPPIVMETR